MTPNVTTGGTFDTFRLSDELDGNHVLLMFYDGDFSTVCSRQLCEYSDADWYQYKTHLSSTSVVTVPTRTSS